MPAPAAHKHAGSRRQTRIDQEHVKKFSGNIREDVYHATILVAHPHAPLLRWYASSPCHCPPRPLHTADHRRSASGKRSDDSAQRYHPFLDHHLNAVCGGCRNARLSLTRFGQEASVTDSNLPIGLGKKTAIAIIDLALTVEPELEVFSKGKFRIIEFPDRD